MEINDNPAIKINGTGPVIMVDDSEADFMIAATYYRQSMLKNEFIHVTSGEKLLTHLDEVATGQKHMPALVLMDINMPRLNGFETVNAVRERGEFASVPIVVMLTSSQRDADRTAARKAGASAYFQKPSDARAYVDFFESLR